MKSFGIIAAVPQEIELLEKALEKSETVKSGGYDYLEGTIGNLAVVICAGGVGKVNAAAATAVMIDRYNPRLVINTGCAGAYIGSGLAVGSLVVASEEVLADDGVVVAEGWKDLHFMNLPSVTAEGETVTIYFLFPETPRKRHCNWQMTMVCLLYAAASRPFQPVAAPVGAGESLLLSGTCWRKAWRGRRWLRSVSIAELIALKSGESVTWWKNVI